ncbi:Winged helix-turn-helix DNA-binding protein [uncultured archaeon]|nr:Winged helix-turn-helix DNA-binding protein [uncultured archaeon]
METYINEEKPLIIEENMGKKVLIATLFNPEPVILATTRLGPQKIVLLISKEPTKEQEASVKLIQDSLGKVIDVKVVKIELYDIVDVAKKVVEIIDLESTDNEIYLNITSGRKTQSIGVLLACYARHERVKKIAYNPEEDKDSSIVYLPRLSFKLTETQKKILEALDKKKYESIAELAEKVEQSTAMLYRNIEELRDMDLVADQSLMLTDAGKIARL